MLPSLRNDVHIQCRDLGVLLANPYRRAMLESVAHPVLQRSMIRGNPEMTELDFRRIADTVLHSDMNDLERLVAAVEWDHKTNFVFFAEAAMRRGAAASAHLSQEVMPCVS